MGQLERPVMREQMTIVVDVAGAAASGKTQLLANIVKHVVELVGKENVNFFNHGNVESELLRRINDQHFSEIDADLDPDDLLTLASIGHSELYGA